MGLHTFFVDIDGFKIHFPKIIIYFLFMCVCDFSSACLCLRGSTFVRYICFFKFGLFNYQQYQEIIEIFVQVFSFLVILLKSY